MTMTDSEQAGECWKVIGRPRAKGELSNKKPSELVTDDDEDIAGGKRCIPY